MKKSKPSHFIATYFLVYSWSDLSSPIKKIDLCLWHAWRISIDLYCKRLFYVCVPLLKFYGLIRQFLFLSLHKRVTKNQIPNTKCEPKFFLLWVTIWKENFQIETTENTEIRCLVFGFWSQADVTKEKLCWFFFLLT